MHHLSHYLVWLLVHYGNLSLFLLLAFGIIGLPIPDETLVAFAGFMVAHNKMPLVSTLLAVYLGSICGITVNYILGKTAARYLVKKYGSYIGITDEKLKHAHNWFERTGKWTLFIGYFIPGVRHLTGYVAGTTGITFKMFAFFAYTGGLVWILTFFVLGYYFGEKIFELLIRFDSTIGLLVLIIVVLFFIYYVYRYFRNKK